MKREITVRLFVGDKPVKTLTDEQLDKMAHRLSKRMSMYYTAHPAEYEKLCANAN